MLKKQTKDSEREKGREREREAFLIDHKEKYKQSILEFEFWVLSKKLFFTILFSLEDK